VWKNMHSNLRNHFWNLWLLLNTSRFLDSLREIGWDGMNCIDLAQDRDQWRPLVNLWFLKMLGNSYVAAELVAPQEGPSSISE
jgi:hypothetical protein